MPDDAEPTGTEEPGAETDPILEPDPVTGPAEGDEPDPWAEFDALPDDQETFDREYVEALRERAETVRTAGKGYADLGDPDVVKEAVELKEMLKSEEGVISLFVESGQALGYGVKELEAFIDSEVGKAAVAAVEEPDPDDDLPMTRGEFKAQMDQAIKDRVEKPALERQESDRQRDAKATVDQTLADLKVTDPDEARAVLAYGQAHLGADDWSPESIRAAVRRGHEELQAQIKKQSQEYLKGKKESKAKQPGSIGAGGSPGGTEPEEAQSVEEAKARVREKLRKGQLTG